MNRAQRRAAARAEKSPRWLPPSQEERLRRIMKNGLTPDDLEREYKTGFNEGFRQAGNPLVRILYAGVMLTLHEQLGFGAQRVIRFMRDLDSRLLTQMSSVDAVDEVYQKLGIEIDFDEPFDRVNEDERQVQACAK